MWYDATPAIFVSVLPDEYVSVSEVGAPSDEPSRTIAGLLYVAIKGVESAMAGRLSCWRCTVVVGMDELKLEIVTFEVVHASFFLAPGGGDP